MPPRRLQPRSLPEWLRDPQTQTELVNVGLLAEKMLSLIKADPPRGLGPDFATRAALTIGKKGRSAPFSLVLAKAALTDTGGYQAAINLFILKLLEDGGDDVYVNYSNVLYLANYYYHVSASLRNATPFEPEHFPHTIHVTLRDISEIERDWDWGIFARAWARRW